MRDCSGIWVWTSTQLIRRNIHIYGNGGKMLPQANNIFRQSDLQENAVYISGESDGQI